MCEKNIAGFAKLNDAKSGKFWDALGFTTVAISYVFPIFHGDNMAIQLDWTGDTTGATKVEISLNYRVQEDGTVINAGTWTDITANAVAKVPFCTKHGTDPAGATGGPVLFIIQQCPTGVIKVTYTPSAGSGTRTMTGIYELKAI